jgi:hypothetical protein
MISFLFRINASFLGYPTRPITVPRSQVSYIDVRALADQSKDVWITVQGHRSVRGQLYHNVAGYGEYYQLRCVEPIWLQGGPIRLGALTRVGLYVADGRLEVDMRVIEPEANAAA